MFGAGDPAGTGLVASLGRPGGNLTGYNERSTELSAKRLELLKEILPRATRVGVLWNAGNRAMTHQYREIEKVASALRVTTLPHAVRGPDDFDAAFSALVRERPDALLVVADALTVNHRQRVFEFAARHGIPTFVESRDMVRDGALLSYGPSVDDGAHRVATFVDRILRGARPGDLPIEQPTRFELVINANTARTIGIALPAGVMMRADEMFR